MTYWQWVRMWLGLHLFIIGGIIGFVLFQSFLRRSRLEPIQGMVLRSVATPREDGSFTPEIQFAYTVDRRKYNGGKYRDGFRPLSLSDAEVEELIQKYPSGSTVEAWYDPQSPSFAVIDRSLGPLYYGLIIVMCGCAGACVLVLVFSRRHRARHAST